MAQQQSKPPKRSFRLIHERRKSLYHQASSFVGCRMEEGRLGELAKALYRGLPKSTSYEAVAGSLRHLAGVTLSEDQLGDAAWRLAGNVDRLTNGQPVPIWQQQTDYEWVLMRVAAARPYRRRRDNAVGVLLRLRVEGGSPAPEIFERFWTKRYCFFLAPHLGFRKRPLRDQPTPRRLHDPSELVLLRFTAMLEPCEVGETPRIHQVYVSGPQLEHNKDIMNGRDRMERGRECPLGYPLSVPCRRCWVGYEWCRGSVHRKPYSFGECGTCGEPDQPFDPERSDGTCVECLDRRALRRAR